MDAQWAIDCGREVAMFSLTLIAPIVGAIVVASLLVSAFQVVTHIQDQSISSMAKILVAILLVAAMLPWMVERMTDYGQSMFERPHAIAGPWESR